MSRFVLVIWMLIIVAPPVHAESGQAGFERQMTPEGIEVGIWYPASGPSSRQRLGLYTQDVVDAAAVPAGRHPLVIMSHGTGGDFASHVDTAVALARAGFIVAALTHPGDNWRDKSRASKIWERPAALSATLSYLLQHWPGHSAIDPERIGAFGFSSGGFTVLAATGGTPTLARLARHCTDHPAFFDCTAFKSQTAALIAPWPSLLETRIKAIVVAAPALGFTFDRDGLAAVRVPVQLWRADDDQILPAPFYADAVKAALPRAPEFHTVPKAGHFDFLARCADPASIPQICASAPGFDRTLFHTTFNDAVMKFFKAKLVAPPTG